MNNIDKGKYGEELAAKYLKKNGYKVIGRNCVFAGAELDIVATLSVRQQKKALKRDYKEGNIKSKAALKLMVGNLEQLLVFVEVKYGSSDNFSKPYERVDLKKQNHIIRAAEGFMFKNNLQMPCRFDVISVVGSRVEHIVDAFR